MAKEDIKGLADSLWKGPSEDAWEKFENSLPKSGIKYYRVRFEKGKLENADDLRDSYAELFDAKEKLVAKVPIFKKGGKKLEGATIHLKSLLSLNRV